jgi:NDP-sugar pyrophosphorylase family protein
VNSDIDDWRITFVDTGVQANIGQRLRAVQPYVEGEELFLANYSDGLTDAPAGFPQHMTSESSHITVGRKVWRPRM